MSSKNGYEIRLDILKLAQQQAWQEYQAEVEAARLTKDDEFIRSAVDSFPRENDILDIADRLYEFVGQQTRSNK